MPTFTVRGVTGTLALDYLLSNLGYYVLLPVLPVLVPRLDPGTSEWWIGVALMVPTLAVRAGALVVSGALQRARIRRAMVGGLLMSAAGFGALALVPGLAGLLGCLALGGLGVSINGLTARVYVTSVLPGTGDRTKVFSAIQVAVNVSAALGPVLANYLFHGRHYGILLGVVALMYVMAAGAVFATVPGSLAPAQGAGRRPMSLANLKTMATDPSVRRVCIVSTVGSLLYAQLFSAFALLIANLTVQPAVRGFFYTLDAILVVVLQIPITAWMTRGMDRGRQPLRYLRLGIVAFSISFVLLGVWAHSLVGAFVALAVFALAEALFTPTVSTAFAEFAAERPVMQVFVFRQIATAAGESAGSFVGGSCFLLAEHHQATAGYWYALAAVGLLTLVSGSTTARRAHEGTR